MSDPPERPCGDRHRFPCGLDSSCDVPGEYFSAKKTSEEIWELYQEENDVDMEKMGMAAWETLETIKEHGPVTAKELADIVGVSMPTIYERLETATEHGPVDRRKRHTMGRGRKPHEYFVEDES